VVGGDEERPDGGSRTTAARLRLAVAGCGQVWERGHRPAVERSLDWTVVAAFDPSPDRLGRVGARSPEVALADTLGSLLVGPRADALLVASPPDSHAELTLRGLGAGLHVLVEKPMAVSAADAREVARVADVSSTVLVVGFNRRLRPSYRALRQRIAGEELEKIEASFRFDVSAWPAAAAAGVLDDVASHGLDLLAWLSRSPVTEVAATAIDGTILRIGLRFASGTRGVLLASHGARAHEWVKVTKRGGTAWLADLGGVARWAAGVPAVSAGRVALHLIGRKLRRAPSDSALAFDAQLAAFASLVRDRAAATDLAQGIDGLRAVAAVEACRASLSGGGAFVVVAEHGHP
jgi:predicted dehydrogenase